MVKNRKNFTKKSALLPSAPIWLDATNNLIPPSDQSWSGMNVNPVSIHVKWGEEEHSIGLFKPSIQELSPAWNDAFLPVHPDIEKNKSNVNSLASTVE